MCVIIYDDLALEAWTQRKERESSTFVNVRINNECQSRIHNCKKSYVLLNNSKHDGQDFIHKVCSTRVSQSLVLQDKVSN